MHDAIGDAPSMARLDIQALSMYEVEPETTQGVSSLCNSLDVAAILGSPRPHLKEAKRTNKRPI